MGARKKENKGEEEKEEGEEREEKEDREKEKYWLSSVIVFKGICSYIRKKIKNKDKEDVCYLTLVNLTREVYSHLLCHLQW